MPIPISDKKLVSLTRNFYVNDVNVTVTGGIRTRLGGTLPLFYRVL